MFFCLVYMTPCCLTISWMTTNLVNGLAIVVLYVKNEIKIVKISDFLFKDIRSF